MKNTSMPKLILTIVFISLFASFVFSTGHMAQMKLKKGTAFILRGNNTIKLTDTDPSVPVYFNDVIQIPERASAVLSSVGGNAVMHVDSLSSFAVSAWRYGDVTGSVNVYYGTFRIENDADNHFGLYAKDIHIESGDSMYALYADKNDDVFVISLTEKIILYFKNNTVAVPAQYYSSLLYGDTLLKPKKIHFKTNIQFRINDSISQYRQIDLSKTPNRELSLFAEYLATFNTEGSFGKSYPVKNIREHLGKPSQSKITVSAENTRIEDQKRRTIFETTSPRYSTTHRIYDQHSIISTLKGN